MSMLGSSRNNSSDMGTPFLHELKKQASFFFKEKIRTARLALTDVTPAELLAEEATNGNPWAPDTRTMGFISRAAFEIDDYWRIVEILHKRLARFDRKHWRESYQALILLEHLLTHGPESVSEEFQIDTEVVKKLGSFQYIDERGFNWGLSVRKKSERVLKLLEKGPLLREERDRARKLSRGIEGFGSFGRRSSDSANGSGEESSIGSFFGRSNSHYSDSIRQDDSGQDNQKENSNSSAGLVEGQMNRKTETEQEPLKENTNANGISEKVVSSEESKDDSMEESKPLLGCRKEEDPKIELQKKEHPFNHMEEHQTAESLLLS